MKHLSALQSEFIKIAVDADWWKNLTKEQQLDYIRTHRKTKMRPSAQPRTTEAITIISKLPKRWKSSLMGKGAGENSEVVQMSGGIKAKEFRDAFKNGASAIAGFEQDANGELHPSFFIERSWEDNKYNAQRMSDRDGNPYDEPKSLETVKRRYSRRRGSWDQHNRDLRMGAIADKLTDRPYKVFMVKPDEQRQMLRQQRKDSVSAKKSREIEKKLVADVIQPVYDYYSEKLAQSLEKMKDVAIPNFDEVMATKGTYKSLARRDSSDIIDDIKRYQDKIGSLQSTVSSFRDRLPSEDVSYSDKWQSNSVKGFSEEIARIKERYAEEIKKAKRSRLRNAAQSLQQDDITDAYDNLLKAKEVELARKVFDIWGSNMDKEEYQTKKNEIMAALVGRELAND